jgi:CRP/FNR family transcriptional regulator, nitrogen fixation regulation protein
VRFIYLLLGAGVQWGVMLSYTRNQSFHARPRTAGLNSSVEIGDVDRLFAIGPRERVLAPNEEIFGEGQSTELIYRLVSGAVRSYKSLKGGCRKIEAFRLPGDIFGVEPGPKHEFCAEAITDVSLLVVRRSVLFSPATYGALLTIMSCELKRVQDHALLLSKSARQRLAIFLLEMSQRMNEPDILELPMSRRDIADYLGLTIETVSRMLSQLNQKNLIDRPTSHHLILSNRLALGRII